jgi:hypothetical protein
VDMGHWLVTVRLHWRMFENQLSISRAIGYNLF